MVPLIFQCWKLLWTGRRMISIWKAIFLKMTVPDDALPTRSEELQGEV
jgi:hypothetical protein